MKNQTVAGPITFVCLCLSLVLAPLQLLGPTRKIPLNPERLILTHSCDRNVDVKLTHNPPRTDRRRHFGPMTIEKQIHWRSRKPPARANAHRRDIYQRLRRYVAIERISGTLQRPHRHLHPADTRHHEPRALQLSSPCPRLRLWPARRPHRQNGHPDLRRQTLLTTSPTPPRSREPIPPDSSFAHVAAASCRLSSFTFILALVAQATCRHDKVERVFAEGDSSESKAIKSYSYDQKLSRSRHRNRPGKQAESSSRKCRARRRSATKATKWDIVTQVDQRPNKPSSARSTNISRTIPSPPRRHRPGKRLRFRWHLIPSTAPPLSSWLPVLRVSIALAQRDTLLAAASFNPVHNELFAAGRGEGATQRQENQRLQSRHAFHQPALHRISYAQSQSQPQSSITTATSRSARTASRRDGSAASISPSVPPAASMASGIWSTEMDTGPEFF